LLSVSPVGCLPRWPAPWPRSSPGYAPIDHVYLVGSGLVSLLAATDDGRSVEIGVIGPAGVVGAEVLLGAERASIRATVAIAGVARRFEIGEFLTLVESSPSIRDEALRSLYSQWVQSQTNALCHALHPCEARLCRWLLQAADALGADVLNLTQESFGTLIGVNRTTISTIAHTLQCAGAIRTVRGKIRLLDKGDSRAERAIAMHGYNRNWIQSGDWS